MTVLNNFGAGHQNTAVEIKASPGAEEVLQTAREYLDTLEPIPKSDIDLESETEIESFPYPTKPNK